MTQPPEGMAAPATPPAPIDPREAVKMPAVALIIAALIGAAFCAVMILLNILGTGLGAMASEGGADQATNLLSGAFGILVYLFDLAVAGFIVYGALQMKDLKNHTLAMVAAIVSMIPCVGPCCVIGVPAGIWALVVLNKSEVKAAFAKK